ncbi:MAG: hypothetical protein COY80_02695 [Candidatus Pacebacteria bacterium CG_4_10_14_0_8_um_filter_42_14]|nr:MAG: hypothetical protein COY80_02695 [Candidatus Pacebacteria bacterium CG_4_10_14_0_8_um_filter_42_14]
MGAAAAFLSTEENRNKTKKVISKAAAEAKKVKAQYDKDPEKFKKSVVAKGKKIAKKVVARAELKKNKVVKKVVKKTIKSANS